MTDLPIDTENDIWHWHSLGHWVVIPTCQGWLRNGKAAPTYHMREACERFPELANRYGQIAREQGAGLRPLPYPSARLYLVPQQPINIEQPHMSWKNHAKANLIQSGLISIANMPSNTPGSPLPVYAPLFGWKDGISAQQSYRIMCKSLNDKFAICMRKDQYAELNGSTTTQAPISQPRDYFRFV